MECKAMFGDPGDVFFSDDIVVSMEYDNLKSWFDSGVTCVGMGSKLISKDILANKNYTLLKENVEKTLKTIKSLR